MSIEEIMLRQFAGNLGVELYGEHYLGLYCDTIEIGFFCVEDWGPWA